MMEDAVRIVNLISDRDIHNGDVALQNAIVRWIQVLANTRLDD